MIRNLKTVGHAFVAILALGAVAASVASAQGKITLDGSVTVDIAEIGAKGSGSNALTAFGTRVECFGSTYKGHNVGSSKPIASGSTTATITPVYNQKECRAFEGTEEHFATIDTNGCDYVLHIGATVAGATNTYAVTADVACPAGVSILVTEFADSGHAFRVCTIAVRSQSGLTGAHVTSTPSASPQDLDISGTFNNIHIERSGVCTGNVTQTATDGSLHINGTVTGTNEEGKTTGITVTDPTC